MARLHTPLYRLVAAITLTCVVWATPSIGHAADSETYVVKTGDNLIGIAAKSSVSLTSLLKANELTVSSLIVPGQRLAVPTTSMTAGSSTAGSSTPGSSTPGSSASSTGSATYTVKWGDTLTGIADRSEVSLSSLLQANDMTARSLIVPGMRLRLPAGAAADTDASSSSPSSPTSSTVPRSYAVKGGDSLIGIAQRHQVTLSSLLATNGMTVTSLIMPGMELRLPDSAIIPTSAPSASTGTAAAPASTGTGVDAVIQYALDQQGKAYQFFSAGPDSFDCSGLTKAAYALIGTKLVHYSAAQAEQGTAVDFHAEQIRPGDLVFLSTRGSETINHVGIAIDSTRWVHAASTNDGVRVGWIPSSGTITAVRRFVATD